MVSNYVQTGFPLTVSCGEKQFCMRDEGLTFSDVAIPWDIVFY